MVCSAHALGGREGSTMPKRDRESLPMSHNCLGHSKMAMPVMRHAARAQVRRGQVAGWAEGWDHDTTGRRVSDHRERDEELEWREGTGSPHQSLAATRGQRQ